MRIEPVALPEFGLELNWAICRNPMCPAFGRDIDVDLPDGAKQRSSRRYTLRTKWAHGELRTAEVQCKYCKLTWSLHSNLAVRAIARYYLSLSLPFADCSNEDCVNHGKNVFEHWQCCLAKRAGQAVTDISRYQSVLAGFSTSYRMVLVNHLLPIGAALYGHRADCGHDFRGICTAFSQKFPAIRRNRARGSSFGPVKLDQPVVAGALCPNSRCCLIQAESLARGTSSRGRCMALRLTRKKP